MSQQNPTTDDQPSSMLPKGFPPLAEDGDIGVAGISLAVGYFGETFLLSHFPHLGVTPGAASIYFSSAMVGIKRTIQALRSKSVAKKLADEKLIAEKAAMEGRGNLILKTLEGCISYYSGGGSRSGGMANDAISLRRDFGFYMQGIITPEQFQEKMDDAVRLIQANDCPPV
jgi:hypothetical protein